MSEAKLREIEKIASEGCSLSGLASEKCRQILVIARAALSSEGPETPEPNMTVLCAMGWHRLCGMARDCQCSCHSTAPTPPQTSAPAPDALRNSMNRLEEFLAPEWEGARDEVFSDGNYGWTSIAITAIRMRVESAASRAQSSVAADDNLVSCARCNEMKECLLIDTGFAGEQEPLCARCISAERAESESPAAPPEVSEARKLTGEQREALDIVLATGSYDAVVKHVEFLLSQRIVVREESDE
jgi:hypothetical protein